MKTRERPLQDSGTRRENKVTAKEVPSLETDDGGLITGVKARVVARSFGLRFAADYFKTFAATSAMTSVELIAAAILQEGWLLYHLMSSRHSS